MPQSSIGAGCGRRWMGSGRGGPAYSGRVGAVYSRILHGVRTFWNRGAASSSAWRACGVSVARVPYREPSWGSGIGAFAVRTPGGSGWNSRAGVRRLGRRHGSAVAAVRCRCGGDLRVVGRIGLCPVCHSVSRLPWQCRFRDCCRRSGLAILSAGLADPAQESCRYAAMARGERGGALNGRRSTAF